METRTRGTAVTIINIRGTNGSGKTTLAKALAAIDTPEPKQVQLTQYYPKGKSVPKPLMGLKGERFVLVGPYRESSKTGGCDGIDTQDLIQIGVRKAVENYPLIHTVFEGVVVSTIYGRYAEFAKEMATTQPMLFVYLDTPLDVCYRRIQQRNGGKPIKEDLVADKYRSIRSTADKLVQAGCHVITMETERGTVPADVLARRLQRVANSLIGH